MSTKLCLYDKQNNTNMWTFGGAMVAEQFRALLHGTEGPRFESCRAHQFLKPSPINFWSQVPSTFGAGSHLFEAGSHQFHGSSPPPWRRWKAERKWKAERRWKTERRWKAGVEWRWNLNHKLHVTLSNLYFWNVMYKWELLYEINESNIWQSVLGRVNSKNNQGSIS